MAFGVHHPRFEQRSSSGRMYSPNILPRLQSLLAILADMEVAYQKKLDVIERSLEEESLRRRMVAELERQHQASRAPYIVEIEELQEQVKASFN
ncbi:hypothetical protein [Microvirga guangxiensis]|uniref:Uncharacterized protein n=1 Tax=Microvirga guangxiensis TaxID=549386 RepID=A0A1G5BRE3_9HYPH|nr:hypothetical protein [Microvirga guangxiensis]SCX92762.1 hypothetical protein SAMN02927923_00323 [Microvirga guangxiensis]